MSAPPPPWLSAALMQEHGDASVLLDPAGCASHTRPLLTHSQPGYISRGCREKSFIEPLLRLIHLKHALLTVSYSLQARNIQ